MSWRKWHPVVVLTRPNLFCYPTLFSDTRSLQVCVAFWEPLQGCTFNCVAEYLEFRYKFKINHRSDFIFLVKKKKTNKGVFQSNYPVSAKKNENLGFSFEYFKSNANSDELTQ